MGVDVRGGRTKPTSFDGSSGGLIGSRKTRRRKDRQKFWSFWRSFS